MIYLNSAATSYPKPQSVITAVTEALKAVPQDSLRSSWSTDDDLPHTLRQRLGELLHTEATHRIFFTSGATDALNRLISGWSWPSVILTTDNHNSVLRPVFNHPGLKDKVHLINSPIEATLPPQTTREEGQSPLLILPHCSNVTGHLHDLQAICTQAHEKGMIVLVDASQSAGCHLIDIDRWGIDMLVFTGHKALLGPQGTGGYYVRDGLNIRPTVFGGTGLDSTVIQYEEGVWEYEPGTPNLPGLAGLKAGVEAVLSMGVEHIMEQGRQQANWLLEHLQRLEHVSVFSQGGDHQGPVVSFCLHGLSPSDVGYILQNSYGITVRTGLHCAPLIHQQLGTYPMGTIRVSFSYATTNEDLAALLSAISDINNSLSSSTP